MNTTELGGIRLNDEIQKLGFYGFKLDPETSNLNIEIIANGDGVIKLPSDIPQKSDYRQWIWTERTLSFNISNNGNLEMTVL